MISATVNETNVHLSREVLELQMKFSEATDIFVSQSGALSSKIDSLSTRTDTITIIASSLVATTTTLSSETDTLSSKVDSLSKNADTLTITASSLVSTTTTLCSETSDLASKVDSLSTKTQSLTSSVDALSSNTSTLATRVDLVASHTHGLVSELTNSVNSISVQVENLTNLTSMAKDRFQQDITLSSIVDKISYDINSTSPCKQLAEEYPTAKSGYYWVSNQGSDPVSTYCIMNSELQPAPSCQQLALDHHRAASDYYWVKDENGKVVNMYCIITSEINPAYSCKDLARDHPHAASDYYWVTNGTMQPVKVYCDMDQHCCNSTGGWVRVANIDMTDTNQQCPPGFHLILSTDSRSCGANIFDNSNKMNCTSINFTSHGIEYSQVCGRMRAYQYGNTIAFFWYIFMYHITVDYPPVYGMSLTHGRYTRQHIWTFASAYSEYYSNVFSCPCTRTDQKYTGTVPPRFIGEDYFCDTASTHSYPDIKVYQDNPLWDGQGCGLNSTCCSFNRPPWFCKQLPLPTTDDLELRVCGRSNGNTPFDQIELYIQ